MYKTKIIFLIISASLLEAVNWGNRILLFLLKYLTAWLTFINDFLCKNLRLHFVLIIKETRSNSRKVKAKIETKPAKPKEVSGSVVGITKTVFITELPDPDELQPIEIIELPLSDPEEPEEHPFPSDDDFECEIDTAMEEDIRREMEESLYEDDYGADVPEEHSSGISVEDMSEAWKIINNEVPDTDVREEVVVSVLDSLKGTDMFAIFIKSEQCECKAKEIMDRHFEKYHKPRADETSPEFNIRHFME